MTEDQLWAIGIPTAAGLFGSLIGAAGAFCGVVYTTAKQRRHAREAHAAELRRERNALLSEVLSQLLAVADPDTGDNPRQRLKHVTPLVLRVELLINPKVEAECELRECARSLQTLIRGAALMYEKTKADPSKVDPEHYSRAYNEVQGQLLDGMNKVTAAAATIFAMQEE